jgi:mercuric ion transport protein
MEAEERVTRSPQIELVYFEGCPNALQARENIKAAVEASGHSVACTEWDLMAESTPEVFRRYGSPTVLVDGRDVTGDGPANAAMACRSDGVPSVATIASKLT